MAALMLILMYFSFMFVPMIVMAVIEHHASVEREERHHDEMLNQLHWTGPRHHHHYH